MSPDLIHATRALSVRQPWADAILYHEKRCENRRKRLVKMPGWLWLHASGQVDARAAQMFIQAGWPPTSQHTGAIIGALEIIGCDESMLTRWDEPGVYHWRIGGVLALPEPVPCAGALSFWAVPDDVLARCVALLGVS